MLLIDVRSVLVMHDWELFILQNAPWWFLVIFILSCNFKKPDKPVVSQTGLIWTRCIGLLFICIYALLHIAEWFPEWGLSELRPLKSKYLIVPVIVQYLAQSFQHKMLVNINEKDEA